MDNFLYTIFPFSWASHQFMQNAFLAILIAAPLYGLLGTVVVQKRMAFFSDSLGHAALTGIAIGVAINVAQSRWVMFAFALVFALALVWVKKRGSSSLDASASMDTTIAIFSATAMALGLVLLSGAGGLQKYTWVLAGDLLSVAPEDLWLGLGMLVAVIFCYLLFFNAFVFIGVSPTLARSKGVPVNALEYLFAALVAGVVAVSLSWVGILIVNALLILPASTARGLSRSLRGYQWLSVGFSLVAGIAGLILSYYLGTSSGATIVLIAAAFYFISLPISRRV